MATVKKLGLIGKTLNYSFSENYFSEKFKKESISNWEYELYELPSIDHLPQLISKNADLFGLNITIPYKKEAFKYLHSIDRSALEVGAVNTLRIDSNRKLRGYNTDIIGFEKSILKLIKGNTNSLKALVLGSGGASNAIVYVLNKLSIPCSVVSRSKGHEFTYKELKIKDIEEHKLIVNCTPLGTFPEVENAADIPYQGIGKDHYLYDLVYNPEKTLFLKKGETNGAEIMNGHEMLILQAEASWDIWNS